MQALQARSSTTGQMQQHPGPRWRFLQVATPCTATPWCQHCFHPCCCCCAAMASYLVDDLHFHCWISLSAWVVHHQHRHLAVVNARQVCCCADCLQHHHTQDLSRCITLFPRITQAQRVAVCSDHELCYVQQCWPCKCTAAQRQNIAVAGGLAVKCVHTCMHCCHRRPILSESPIMSKPSSVHCAAGQAAFVIVLARVEGSIPCTHHLHATATVSINHSNHTFAHPPACSHH